jgi:type I restriction enzyme S subunit
MNKENKLIPELRFPEFEDKETWAERKLSSVLFEHKEKSTGKEEVYSVSVHKGVINQIEHLGRNYAASNTENYKRVLPGDIIYTKSPTGSFPFGIIKQSKVSKPVIVSPLYGVFTPETVSMGVILDAYFEYPERTVNYLSSIIQKGAKNTINIHNDNFLSKSLALPIDLKEQQKIASCLSSLDEHITAHNQKLDLLKDHKKGLMQNLFPQEGETVPKWRFKEFEIDGEWVEKPLGEICEMQAGKFVSASEIKDSVSDSLFPCYGGNGLRGYTKSFTHTGKFSLIGRQGALCGNVTMAEGKFHATEHAVVVTPEKNIDTVWLYYVLIFLNLNQYATGQAQPGLSVGNLEKLKLKVSDNQKEQQKIASCLSSLDELIKAQAEKIEKLKLHKKGLMQGLFPKVV